MVESTAMGVIRGEYTFLDANPFAKIDGNNVYYYHNDHLGTPQKLTDAAGSVVWYGELLPFGEPLSVSGTIINNFRFPGQYYDEETGLHYNWHRDYKTEVGRYIEFDPIGLGGGINPYIYAANNPSKYIDIKGESLGAGIGAIFGAGVGCIMIHCTIKCSDRCENLYPDHRNPLSPDRQKFWNCMGQCMTFCASFGLFGTDPLTGAITAPSHPH
jgi:RHS repeat-associated protein